MTGYTDPSVAKQVAEFADLLVTETVGPSVRKPYGTENVLYHPWSDDAPRWQLPDLLEAMKEAGLWDEVLNEITNYFIDEKDFDLVTQYHFMTTDPRIVYQAAVVVLRSEEEIE